MAFDSYTKVLLHFGGADASTTFTDEIGSTWTARADAQIDTAQKQFGTGSGLFDGTGDYIDTPDHANWQLDGGSDSNAWTIDFWVRFNGAPGAGTQGLVSQFQDNGNSWWFRYTNTVLQWNVRSGASNTVTINRSWTPADATWYHVALVKNGTTGYMFFVDGTQISTTATDTDTIPDLAGLLRVGVETNGAGVSTYLNGWIDEFRISVGIARWTANFTPPGYAYSGQNASAVAGALTSSGVIVKAVAKPTLAGALTSSGAVAKRISKAFTGAISFLGSLASLISVDPARMTWYVAGNSVSRFSGGKPKSAFIGEKPVSRFTGK